MKSGINKAAFILLFVFLTGCGREEITAETENEELVSAEIEEIEDTLKEETSQYPIIATPSDAEWLDLVIVSEDTYCIFNGKKYGFLTEDGKEIAPCTYDVAYPFSEGLAYYSIDGRYGYVDQKGQVVIEPQFDDAGYFSEGLVKVMKNGSYGVIDRDGAFILAAEYDSVTIYDSFIITKSNGNYSCFDSAGRVLLEQSDDIYVPTGEEYAYFVREGKRGLIDIKRNILIEPMYNWISLQTPEQNLLLVRENGLYGVVDLQGEVKIPVMYDDIEYDSYVDSAEGGMFLLTDADGNIESVDAADFSEKIPCSYDGIDWISQDKAVVSQDRLSGIIDREGNVIEPVEYDVIRFFEDGAVWMKKGKKNCFYNSCGEKAEDRYDYDSIDKIGNCYQIKKDGKYGVLNEQGEEVFSPVYDNISDYGVCGGSFNVYVIGIFSVIFRILL